MDEQSKEDLINNVKIIENKNILSLTSTNWYAIKNGSKTIHSFFEIYYPFELKLNENPKISLSKKVILNQVDTILINDILMLDTELLHFTDHLLKFCKNNYSLPFGGVQIILFGDIFEFENMKLDLYNSKFFINNYFKFIIFNNKVFDIKIEGPRINAVDFKFDFIKKRNFNNLNFKVKIVDLIKDSNSINQRELDLNSNLIYQYVAKIEGQFDLKNTLIKYNLNLKLGIKVILIEDSDEYGICAGEIGEVSKLTDKEIFVRFNNIEIEIFRKKWQRIDYVIDSKNQIKVEIIGEVFQYPLAIAYSIPLFLCLNLKFKNVEIYFTEFNKIYSIFKNVDSLYDVDFKYGVPLIDFKNTDSYKMSKKMSIFDPAKLSSDFIEKFNNFIKMNDSICIFKLCFESFLSCLEKGDNINSLDFLKFSFIYLNRLTNFKEVINQNLSKINEMIFQNDNLKSVNTICEIKQLLMPYYNDIDDYNNENDFDHTYLGLYNKIDEDKLYRDAFENDSGALWNID